VMERSGRGRCRARVLRVLHPNPEADEAAEVRRLTEEMTKDLEEAIRGRPDHWYWLHRRWKTPPREAIPAPIPAAVRTCSRSPSTDPRSACGSCRTAPRISRYWSRAREAALARSAGS